MQIEDAIRRYESWAKDDRIDLRIRKEHEQIAEWLKELQRLRPSAKTTPPIVGKGGNNDGYFNDTL